MRGACTSSGTVEIGEVRQAIDMLGIRYTYKQLDELFAKFDSNGDQEFDIYEFKMVSVCIDHPSLTDT